LLSLLKHEHGYTSAGAQSITATITDDDGGVASSVATVEAQSLEGAIQGVADELTQRIAQATSPGIRSALTAARDDLIGNHNGKSSNGALDKLRANDPLSAITKLQAAIASLAIAQSLGAGDLSSPMDLLGLVAEAMATSAYEQARSLIGSPSPGQAGLLTAIANLISTGHAQLAARQYSAACHSYRMATAEAFALRR
jgi:hypothetical protein